MPDCSDRAPPQLRLLSSSVPRKLVQKGHSFSPFAATWSASLLCAKPRMWRFINQRAAITKPTYATHCNHVQSKLKQRDALSYIHCKLSIHNAVRSLSVRVKANLCVAGSRKDMLAWRAPEMPYAPPSAPGRIAATARRFNCMTPTDKAGRNTWCDAAMRSARGAQHQLRNGMSGSVPMYTRMPARNQCCFVEHACKLPKNRMLPQLHFHDQHAQLKLACTYQP